MLNKPRVFKPHSSDTDQVPSPTDLSLFFYLLKVFCIHQNKNGRRSASFFIGNISGFGNSNRSTVPPKE